MRGTFIQNKNRVLITLILMLLFVITNSLYVSAKNDISTVLKIGDYLQMGSYYKEPILWRCVDIDENGPLMLADKILTIKPFDVVGSHQYLDGSIQVDPYELRKTSGSNLWETSNLRCWLNSTDSGGKVKWVDNCPPKSESVYSGLNAYANESGFISSDNFKKSEIKFLKTITQKSLLNESDVNKLADGGSEKHTLNDEIASINQNYNNAYFQNVTDKMFLLDVKQLNNVYLNSSKLGQKYWMAYMTPNALKNSGVKETKMSLDKYWYYWTRTPYSSAISNFRVRFVHIDGYVSFFEAGANGVGVRPAFYFDESKLNEGFLGNGNVASPYQTQSSIEDFELIILISGIIIVISVATIYLIINKRKRRMK